jgi:hypothetical protein
MVGSTIFGHCPARDAEHSAKNVLAQANVLTCFIVHFLQFVFARSPPRVQIVPSSWFHAAFKKRKRIYRRTRLHTSFLWHNNPKTAKECQRISHRIQAKGGLVADDGFRRWSAKQPG